MMSTFFNIINPKPEGILHHLCKRYTGYTEYKDNLIDS